MTGPCLCGDPACGLCFPQGQTRMKCAYCGWRGKRYDLNEDVDESLSICPECGQHAAEERIDFDLSLDIDNPQERQ